ncbi:MAG TPA: HDOD domain-containing protein [Steroidobacteraceae bacterium]|nr:HDOD domain-containing protein [Steroidobacteraceae bacterium]
MTKPDTRIDGHPSVQALVARQSIVNAQMEVVAYELLYRGLYGMAMATDIDPAAATSSLLVDAILELGFEQLAGNLPMHVNFPESMLESDAPLGAPPDRLIIEVLESVRGTPIVLTALAAFRQRGYRIAIDDYVPGCSDAALLAQADIVKLDLGVLSAEEAAASAQSLLAQGKVCVAEKVESRAQFVICRDAGIQLFQGYFLQRPETFYGRRVAVNCVTAVHLLAQLQRMDWSIRDAERLIASDAGLSYKLLRAVQTASFYATHQVSSLSQAIVVLGRDQLIRILSLIMLSRFRGRPTELMRNALHRARLCELLAGRSGVDDCGPYFMVGLLSLMPAMLGERVEETVSSLPLSEGVRNALLTHAGDLGAALDCVDSLERADWSQVRFGALSLTDINTAYVEACGWVEDSMARVQAI